MTLPRSTRIWIAWVGLVHLAFAYFAMFRPDLLQSSAYTWAASRVPFAGWAIISMVVAGLVVASALHRSTKLAFLALGVSLPTQVTFGLSIFVLSFEGTTSAVVGSFQWWSMAVGNGCILYGASAGTLSYEPEAS